MMKTFAVGLVDNARPQKYNISIRQGVISSRQKLHLDLTCRRKEPSRDDTIQVRFFKWPRPCHGIKPRSQQYIGFREVKLHVYNDRSERERTPSQSSHCDMPEGGATPSLTGSQGMSSLGSSGNPPYQSYHDQHPHYLGTGDFSTTTEENFADGQHHRTQKLQVLINLGVTVVLLVLGFLLNKTDEGWFSTNVLDGVKPHTIAVVCYRVDDFDPRIFHYKPKFFGSCPHYQVAYIQMITGYFMHFIDLMYNMYHLICTYLVCRWLERNV